MKTEYCYAIVDYNGRCWTIVGRATEEVALTDLLAEGWRPVRETPFPEGQQRILICLEREPDGKIGFGFGP